MMPGVVTASSCGFRKYAAIIGVSVRATSSENSTATVTVKPKGRKNSPGMPPMNATGMNTAHIVSVVATTARPISIAASVAASQRRLALRKWRTMFSTSTIASSTSMPTTSVSASSVSMFSVKPRPSIAQNVGMIDSGSASADTSVARQSRRNSHTTMIARIAPSTSISIDESYDSGCSRPSSSPR